VIRPEDFERWQERKRRAHDASDSETSRCTLRFQVRRRAKAWGLEVPGWAETRDMSSIVRAVWAKRPRVNAKPKHTKKTQRRGAGLLIPPSPAREKTTRQASAPKPAASRILPKRWRPQAGGPRRRAKASAVVPNVATDIPPELRAWRERAGVGACVGIDRRGRVILVEVGSVRRFASVAEAVLAVA
jgi:hypothetical protein